MTFLLDANVLIALIVVDHVHHDVAEEWFSGSEGRFATCPITEGSLIRLLIREGQTVQASQEILAGLAEDHRHEFWAGSIPFDQVGLSGVIGHRQVTDAYLAQLARVHGGRLVTFDQGLAELHFDVADLLTGSK